MSYALFIPDVNKPLTKQYSLQSRDGALSGFITRSWTRPLLENVLSSEIVG